MNLGVSRPSSAFLQGPIGPSDLDSRPKNVHSIKNPLYQRSKEGKANDDRRKANDQTKANFVFLSVP